MKTTAKLKTSISWEKKMLASISAHGISLAAGATKPNVKRFWSFVFLAAVIFAAVQLFSIFKKFYKFEIEYTVSVRYFPKKFKASLSDYFCWLPLCAMFPKLSG